MNQKLVDLNNIVSRVLDFTIAKEGLYGMPYNDTSLRIDINNSCSSVLQLNQYFNDPQYYDFFTEFNQDINFRFFDQDLNYTDTDISFEASLLLVNFISYSVNNLFAQFECLGQLLILHE